VQHGAVRNHTVPNPVPDEGANARRADTIAANSSFPHPKSNCASDPPPNQIPHPTANSLTNTTANASSSGLRVDRLVRMVGMHPEVRRRRALVSPTRAQTRDRHWSTVPRRKFVEDAHYLQYEAVPNIGSV
jgi:hypothetical protein